MGIIIKIIIVLLIVIIGVVLLLFFVSFFGGIFSLGYFIKKATEKKTPEFLANEKLEMKSRTNTLIHKLEDWKNYSVNDITNDLDYSYSRQITSKLFGVIKSKEGEKIIAFLRHQRGNYIDCRIFATSTEFNYFFEIKNDLTIVEFNDNYFGKIVNESAVYDSANLKVADIIKKEVSYQINFIDGNSITINRSFDNKLFVNNPFYTRPNDPIKIRRRMKLPREQYVPYPMISDKVILNSNAENWVTAIVLKETIFNSFSFVS